MARFVKILCATAALAVFITVASPTKACASFELEIQASSDGIHWTDEGSVTITPPSSILNASFTIGDFTVTETIAVSNSPGDTVNGATLTQTNVAITSVSGSDGTIYVEVSAQGYSIPESPPLATLTSSSTLNTQSGSTTETATSYVDLGDALFGTSGAATAPLTVTASGQGGYGSGSDTTSFSASGTYSLTNEVSYTFTGVTAANQELISEGNVSTTVTTPVPSTAVLALSGLPLLGLGLWLRRRKTRKVPVAA